MPLDTFPQPKAEGDFAANLAAKSASANSLLCVGLDPDLARLPRHLRDEPEAVVRFNAAIIEATSDLVCAYKPNLGFYVAAGTAGIAALVETRKLIPATIPVILDCKVGDIGHTAQAYARGYFDEWGFDGVTANPYLGEESLAPFLGRADRGVFLLAKTSNPGSAEIQDIVVCNNNHDEPVYMHVARQAAAWAKHHPATLGLVTGATYPAQLREIRAACPHLPLLLPGIGAQSGDLEAAVSAGLDATGGGIIVNASRSIIYAGDGADFAAKARDAAVALRDAINQHRPSRSDE